jgi:hypothetical protein
MRATASANVAALITSMFVSFPRPRAIEARSTGSSSTRRMAEPNAAHAESPVVFTVLESDRI